MTIRAIDIDIVEFGRRGPRGGNFPLIEAQEEEVIDASHASYVTVSDTSGIKRALLEVSTYKRAGGSETRIDLPEGEHQFGEQILGQVDAGAPVIIQGVEPITLGTIVGVSIESNAAGNHEITVTLDAGHSLSEAAYDDMVDISAVVAASDKWLDIGIPGPVLAKSGDTLTYLCTSRHADLATRLAGIGFTSATLKKYPTVLSAVGTDIASIDPIRGGLLLETHENPGLFEILERGSFRLKWVAFRNRSSDADCQAIMLRDIGRDLLATQCIFYNWLVHAWAISGAKFETQGCGFAGGGGSDGGGVIVSYEGKARLLSTTRIGGVNASGIRGRDANGGNIYAPGIIIAGCATAASSEGPDLTATTAKLVNSVGNNCRLNHGAKGNLRGTKLTDAVGRGLKLETGAQCEVSATTDLRGATDKDLDINNGRLFWDGDNAPLYDTWRFANRADLNGTVYAVVLPSIIKTADYTVTLDDAGQVFTNTNDTELTVFTLPPATTTDKGMEVEFVNDTTLGMRIVCAGDDAGQEDEIRWGAALAGQSGSVNGTIETTVKGAKVRLRMLNGNEWIVVAGSNPGDWLFDGVKRVAGFYLDPPTRLNTTPNTLTKLDHGKTFENTGATALIVVNLPALATGDGVGCLLRFNVTDTDGFQLVAAAGDRIHAPGSITPTGGNIQATTLYSSITLYGEDGNGWLVVATPRLSDWTFSS